MARDDGMCTCPVPTGRAALHRWRIGCWPSRTHERPPVRIDPAAMATLARQFAAFGEAYAESMRVALTRIAAVARDAERVRRGQTRP